MEWGKLTRRADRWLSSCRLLSRCHWAYLIMLKYKMWSDCEANEEQSERVVLSVKTEEGMAGTTPGMTMLNFH